MISRYQKQNRKEQFRKDGIFEVIKKAKGVTVNSESIETEDLQLFLSYEHRKKYRKTEKKPL